jgi:hypothetical protein
MMLKNWPLIPAPILRKHVSRYDWGEMAGVYDERLAGIASAGR